MIVDAAGAVPPALLTNSASIASGVVGFTTSLPTSSLKRNSPRDFRASLYLFPTLSWPVTVVTSKKGWSESMLTYRCPTMPVAASTATLFLLKASPWPAGSVETTKNTYGRFVHTNERDARCTVIIHPL